MMQEYADRLFAYLKVIRMDAESIQFIQDALETAHSAHESVGQRRKYTNEPYIVHPLEVALLVAASIPEYELIAAALLHDTVEDTHLSLLEIENQFGKNVASLVEQLTDVSKPSDGNRRIRKEIDRAHTAKASPAAKTIKLADLISNSATIVEHDRNFARVYMREKERLLDVLTEGDPRLYAIAKALVDKYKTTL